MWSWLPKNLLHLLSRHQSRRRIQNLYKAKIQRLSRRWSNPSPSLKNWHQRLLKRIGARPTLIQILTQSAISSSKNDTLRSLLPLNSLLNLRLYRTQRVSCLERPRSLLKWETNHAATLILTNVKQKDLMRWRRPPATSKSIPSSMRTCRRLQMRASKLTWMHRKTIKESSAFSNLLLPNAMWWKG